MSQRITYQPALDGVRAVSVIAVLLFHGGVGWMTGGYVGVSVFFTLSGYLVTTLLLRRYVLAPLTLLTQQVSRIRASGDSTLSTRPPK